MGIKLRKGDRVEVIAGNDKGKVGRVLAVDEKKQRVTIERINFVKRHTKPRKQGVPGGILEREAPIHISNVMLYDDKAGRGTRIGSKVLPDGTRQRVSRASGETIAKGE
jgi:large subunit ribosomal protein L24